MLAGFWKPERKFSPAGRKVAGHLYSMRKQQYLRVARSALQLLHQAKENECVTCTLNLQIGPHDLIRRKDVTIPFTGDIKDELRSAKEHYKEKTMFDAARLRCMGHKEEAEQTLSFLADALRESD